MGNIFIGDSNSKARKVTNAYVGIDGKARKVKAVYVGDSSGKARLVWQSMITKINSWKHYVSRSVSNLEPSYSAYHIASTEKPITLDDNENRFMVSAYCRNSNGEVASYAIIEIEVDNDANIIDYKYTSIGSDVIAKCKLPSLNAYAYTSYSSYYNCYCLSFVNYNNLGIEYTTLNGRVDDLYKLDDSSVIGGITESDGVYLYKFTYAGYNNITKTRYLLVSGATNIHLFKLSSNQYFITYILNGTMYIAPLKFSSLTSSSITFSLGAASALTYTNWSGIQSEYVFPINDSYAILSARYGNYAIGVSIKNNVLSLSNEIFTGSQICRIGKSTSFFSFYDNDNDAINKGAIFYYDINSNTITALNTAITPTTYNNPIYPISFYAVLRPRGEKGITMIYNPNNDYTYSYDLLFDV